MLYLFDGLKDLYVLTGTIEKMHRYFWLIKKNSTRSTATRLSFDIDK